ncbi:Membrane-associated, eicosanoid/glutathione metabolism (MAPEG) protein [Cordyceps fumosorosea ARSEF 2679]|uniref:Membrane-associated, eicosanoid/glutathione metabolism (MAPEG) protein n=1 Tax=Cordyceps fumosorosea (strain ARSEF 2679) TaxID=1081104 RepID=A0A167UBF4_CORFA|nr:Membrane-associated, eicosanoid/glutathione metabolism (MAPEG) protein [Cordyceps fumosorosea ARSEF 2679]OAA61415.1 Membrane-associated, eicosanoid/glutathione metabolism (MAPEG) protein [Cordyceps fumosorosea ARSEF 2679]
MPSLSTIFGLSAATGDPNLMVAEYLIANILLSHTFSSARVLKMRFGLDNHISPRADLERFGPRAVLEGRLSQAQLDMLKRNEAAHGNSMDHLPVFAAALILAKVAGLPAADINYVGLTYTLTRIAYVGNYLVSSSLLGASLRPVLWWTANLLCLRLIWRAGKAFN